MVSIQNCFLGPYCNLVSVLNHSPKIAILKVCRDYSLFKFNYFLSFSILDLPAPVLTTPDSLDILPLFLLQDNILLFFPFPLLSFLFNWLSASCGNFPDKTLLCNSFSKVLQITHPVPQPGLSCGFEMRV